MLAAKLIAIFLLVFALGPVTIAAPPATLHKPAGPLGQGTCPKKPQAITLTKAQCAESGGTGWKPKATDPECKSMAEVTDLSAILCYGRKRLYLYEPHCGIFARTVRLSGPECAKYNPTGWAEGKNEHGNEYVGCIGVKSMEARNNVTGKCFSPADNSYKITMGKCRAHGLFAMKTEVRSVSSCHGDDGKGWKDHITGRCWPPDKMKDWPGGINEIGVCFGARSKPK